MARPTKPPADKKAITLKVRVTAEQERRLRDAADMVGLELSTWIRFVALEQADKHRAGREQARATDAARARADARDARRRRE